MIPFFATTTRGLEAVSAAEISEIGAVSGIRKAYRRVEGQIAGDLGSLGRLSTLDDVFLCAGTMEGLETLRTGLRTLGNWITSLDFPALARQIGSFRALSAQPGFSVSASFVGKRNYSSEEIKTIVGKAISALTGWEYLAENAAELNLRIFIEHETVLAGLRLTRQALHARAYKTAHLPGSLKPSIAAAMVRLAEGWPAARLLDPLCGAGTIAIEASLAGLTALGGDRSAKALRAARENTPDGSGVSFYQENALALPLPTQAVDFVVSNLPWGRQVEAEMDLAQFYPALCLELERVLHPAGKLVLLTNAAEHLRFIRYQLEHSLNISVFGQTPDILIYSRS